MYHTYQDHQYDNTDSVYKLKNCFPCFLKLNNDLGLNKNVGFDLQTFEIYEKEMKELKSNKNKKEKKKLLNGIKKKYQEKLKAYLTFKKLLQDMVIPFIFFLILSLG